MIPTLSTRKTVYRITREDFSRFPVWEWAIEEEGSGGEDESLVRPTPLQSIPPREFAHFIVAASATLRSGSVLPAYAEVMVKGDAIAVTPVSIFLHDRHLDIAAAETTRALSYLTRENDNYPATWALQVPVDGEPTPRRGQVPRSRGLQLLAIWRRLKLVRQTSVI